jgi:FixJ family two-component response regulator
VTMTRVLVVDDDERIVANWERLLEPIATVVRAPSVESVSRLIDRAQWILNPCECVFLDLRLPDGDGEHLLAAFEALRPAPAIAVVRGFLDAERALRLHGRCALVVPKPASRDVLHGMVAYLRVAHEGRSALTEFAERYCLSPTEAKLVFAAVRETTNKETAEQLGCAESTVRGLWSRILKKTGCHSQRDVIVRLFRFAQEGAWWQGSRASQA